MGISTYLPAFFRHDGFRLKGDYQDKMNDAAFYGNRVAPARGYTHITYNDLLTLRADYKVPILYPDWNLSSLIYFKRITFGLFGDYSILPDLRIEGQNGDDFFWSLGTELSTDVFFLRSKFPLNLGVRASYINGYNNNTQGIKYEFIYGMSI